MVSRPKFPDCIMRAPGRRVSIAWDSSVPNPVLERLRRPEKHKLKRPRSALSGPTDAYNFPRPQDFLAPMADEKFYYCTTPPTLCSRRPHSFYIDPTAMRSDLSHLPETVPPSGIPTGNSWYLASPYDVTPRFTRLGLANVILPVSAKAHSRGTPSVVYLHPSPSSNTLKPQSTILNKFIGGAVSTPSNPVAHLLSSTLSSTVELESDAGPPTTPNPTSTTDLPTSSFASKADDSSLVLDHGGRRKFSFSRMPKNSLARFKSLRFFKKKIFDSSDEAFEVRLQVDPDRPNALKVEELVVKSAKPHSAPKPEPLSRGGTIRRIWTSLSAGSKNRL